MESTLSFSDITKKLVAARRWQERPGAIYDITIGQAFNDEYAKAVLIHMAKLFARTEFEADIALASWGLLDNFYDEEEITKRRERLIRATGYNGKDRDDLKTRKTYTKEQLDARVDKLVHHEDRIYLKQIAENFLKTIGSIKAKGVYVYDIEKIKEFVSEAIRQYINQDKAVLPSPSYLERIKESTIGCPKRNLHFLGREKVLKEIEDQFFDEKVEVQILCGMAGVGKSTIAREYIYRNRGFYGSVWWLNAADEKTLTDSCITILKQRKKDYIDTNDAEAIRLRFHQLLENESFYLIVFDNADFLDDKSDRETMLLKNLQDHIPQNGHTLITTRCKVEFEWAHMIPVECFDHSLSVKYLVNNSGQEENEFTHILADRIANLPLALCYAASYIKQHTTYEGYLELWDHKSPELWDDKEGHYADRTVRHAFNITLNKIKESLPNEDTELLINLLNLCALFEAEYLPIDAYIDYIHSRPERDYEKELCEKVLSGKTVGRCILHSASNRYYHTRFTVIDENTYEERWTEGPSQGKLVPPDQENKKSLLIPALEGALSRHRLIRRATQYSLVEYDDGKFRMHPLLREIIRDQMFDKEDPNAPTAGPWYRMIAEVLRRHGDQEAASSAARKDFKHLLNLLESDVYCPPFSYTYSRETDSSVPCELNTNHLIEYDIIFDELLELGDTELIKEYIALRTSVEYAIISYDDDYPCAAQVREWQKNFYNRIAQRLGRILVLQRYNSPSEILETGKQYSYYYANQFIAPESTGTANDPALSVPVILLDDPTTAFDELIELLRDDTRRWTCIALPPEYNDPKQFSSAQDRFIEKHGLEIVQTEDLDEAVNDDLDNEE